jgi:transposase
MKAYSLDLRHKIIDAYQRKQGSQRQLAQIFGVSRSFVEKLFRQRRQTGSLAPRRQGGGHKPLLDPEALELVRQLVEERPDLTLRELCDAVHQEQGIRVSVPTMCTWLQRLGLVRKKVSPRQRAGHPQDTRGASPLPARHQPGNLRRVEVHR